MTGNTNVNIEQLIQGYTNNPYNINDFIRVSAKIHNDTNELYNTIQTIKNKIDKVNKQTFIILMSNFIEILNHPINSNILNFTNEESQPEEPQPEEPQPELLQSESLQSESSQPESSQLESSQPEPIQPEPIQPKQIQPKPIQPEQIQPEQIQPEQIQSKPTTQFEQTTQSEPTTQSETTTQSEQIPESLIFLRPLHEINTVLTAFASYKIYIPPSNNIKCNDTIYLLPIDIVLKNNLLYLFAQSYESIHKITNIKYEYGYIKIYGSETKINEKGEYRSYIDVIYNTIGYCISYDFIKNKWFMCC